MPSGRKSTLDDPADLQVICELFSAGFSRQQMMEELAEAGIEIRDPKTITRWKKDARVQVLVERLNRERIIEVQRKIDSIIQTRLNEAERLSIKELVDLRKTFGGGEVSRKEIASDTVTSGAIKAIEDDPDFAARFAAAFEGDAEEAVAEPVEA